MIIVKIELHSAKNGATRSLGQLRIANNLKGTDNVGEYDWELLSEASLKYDDTIYVAEKGTIKHRRKNGALKLVEKILKEINARKM